MDLSKADLPHRFQRLSSESLEVDADVEDEADAAVVREGGGGGGGADMAMVCCRESRARADLREARCCRTRIRMVFRER